MEETAEMSKSESKLTKEDLQREMSQKVTKLKCANRDGDLYYINCPDCDCTDLQKISLYMCRTCGTHFDLYHEDGRKEILLRDYPYQTERRMLIGTFDKEGDYFEEWFKITPRIESYNLPFLRTKTLYKDLQKDGKDGHGHHKYKRYALIPLGEVINKEDGSQK